MNTILKAIPDGDPSGTLTSDPRPFSFIEFEPGIAYAIKVKVPSRNAIYVGSFRLLTESTANTAGTRRLLVKVELPLVEANSTNSQSCCCCTPEIPESGIPTVSAHMVLTVPKMVVQDLTKGEASATDRLTIVVRLLQSALGALLLNPNSGEEAGKAAAGEVLMENLIYVNERQGDVETTQVMAPLTYDQVSGAVVLNKDVPPNAHLFGLVGGLRPLV